MDTIFQDSVFPESSWPEWSWQQEPDATTSGNFAFKVSGGTIYTSDVETFSPFAEGIATPIPNYFWDTIFPKYSFPKYVFQKWVWQVNSQGEAEYLGVASIEQKTADVETFQPYAEGVSTELNRYSDDVVFPIRVFPRFVWPKRIWQQNSVDAVYDRFTVVVENNSLLLQQNGSTIPYAEGLPTGEE